MKKIYFRADASETIGYGHFIRTLALADMLKEQFDCVYFTTSPTNFQINEINKVCNLFILNEENGDQVFLDNLHGDEIVFLDNYFFTSEYEKRIKEIGCKLVVLSTPNKHHYADIILNFVETDHSKYSVETYSKIISGIEWSLLRQPFLSLQKSYRKRDNRIVVSFGGTDQFCITEKFIQFLRGYDIAIVCTSKVSIERRDRFKKSGCKVFVDVDAHTIADLFQRSAYAVLSSSSICLEALACGCKVLSGYYVDNQIQFYKILLKSNCIVGLGNLLDVNINTLRLCLETKGGVTNECKVLKDIVNQSQRYIELFQGLC